MALGSIPASCHLEMTPQELLDAPWPPAWAQLSRKGFSINEVIPRLSLCLGMKGGRAFGTAQSSLGWALHTGSAPGMGQGERGEPQCLLLHDKMT